jgi:hypothetical protein
MNRIEIRWWIYILESNRNQRVSWHSWIESKAMSEFLYQKVANALNFSRGCDRVSAVVIDRISSGQIRNSCKPDRGRRGWCGEVKWVVRSVDHSDKATSEIDRRAREISAACDWREVWAQRFMHFNTMKSIDVKRKEVRLNGLDIWLIDWLLEWSWNREGIEIDLEEMRSLHSNCDYLDRGSGWSSPAWVWSSHKKEYEVNQFILSHGKWLMVFIVAVIITVCKLVRRRDHSIVDCFGWNHEGLSQESRVVTSVNWHQHSHCSR